jgi:hypothetical protein
MNQMPRKLGATLIACLASIAGCAEPMEFGADEPLDEGAEIASTEHALGEGYVTESCTLAEVEQIHAAMGVLLQTINSGLPAFRACVESAPLVEFSCPSGQGRQHIVDSFRFTQVTHIECHTFDGNANADAHVGISDTKLRIDRSFLMASTPRRVASVIAHEIMHNRGYTHSQHDFETTYFDNTVNEQVESCILTGSPHASRGPLTDSFADRCDGGAYRTLRRGMQACPVGMYLTGIHIDNGYALCKAFPGESYSTSQELIDSHTKVFNMRNCPPGYAMTGVHVDNSQVLCAPFTGTGARFVEASLIRQDMRACPVGSVATGIHADDGKLTCLFN